MFTPNHVRTSLELLGAALLLQSAVAGQAPNLQDPQLLPGSPVIGPAAETQRTPVVAAGSESSLMVFEDQRAGDSDLFGVRLDASGAPIDALPFPITKDPAHQTAPKVSWNGESWLVVYENEVDPGSGYFASEFAARRVSPAGVVLDAAPIAIFQDSTGGAFAVASDGTDWAVLTTGYSAGNNDVRARRIAADGTLLDPGGVVIWPGSYYILFGLEASFAGGQYLFTWSDNGLRGVRTTPQLQVIDPSPVLLPTPAGSITANGSEYFVAWSRQTPIFTSEVVGQRLAPDLTALGHGPISISGFASGVYHSSPTAVWDGAQWVVSWLFLGSQNARIARVSTVDAVLDPGGVAVPEGSSGALHSPTLGALPAGGALFAWDDYRNGGYDVFGVPFGAQGAMGAEAFYSLGSEAQRSPRVAVGSDGYLVTFRAELANSSRVLAQRVDSLGNALDQEPIEVIAAGHTGLYAGGAAWNGTHYLVAWTDTSQGGIFARRMTAEGTFVDPAPIFVLLGGAADVAALGQDFLVTGLRAPGSPQYVFSYGARLRGSDGALLDDPALAIEPNHAARARVVALGNRWLVATESHVTHDESQTWLKLNFVGADGTVDPSFQAGIVNINHGWGIIDLASSDTSALVVAQNGSNWTNVDVYARRILPDGSMPAPISNLTSAVGKGQRRPTVTWTGSEYLVAYESFENNIWGYDLEPDVFAVRLAEGGTQLDGTGFPVFDSEDYEQQLDSGGIGNGKGQIAASTYVDEPYATFRVSLRGLRPAGLESYGTGTPGCSGAHHIDANEAPTVGSASFAITCDNAPPGGVGFTLLATAADEPGSDPFLMGILLHVEPIASLLTLVLPVAADAQGHTSLVQPLPTNPAFAGFTFHAQAAFFWVGPCSPSPSGFSTSDGLHVTLQP